MGASSTLLLAGSGANALLGGQDDAQRRRSYALMHAADVAANAKLDALGRGLASNIALSQRVGEEVVLARADIQALGDQVGRGMNHLAGRMDDVSAQVAATGAGLAQARLEMRAGLHGIDEGLEAVHAEVGQVQQRVVEAAMATALEIRMGVGVLAEQVGEMSRTVTDLLSRQHEAVMAAHARQEGALTEIHETLKTPAATQAREASERARAFLRKAGDTGDPDARTALYQRARAQLDAVMRAGHARTSDYLDLAWLLQQVFDDPEGAREHYLLASVEVDGTDDVATQVYLCEQLGALEQQRGSPARARGFLARACELAPERGDLGLWLADLLAEAGDGQAAADRLDQALSAHPWMLPSALMFENLMGDPTALARLDDILARWDGLRERALAIIDEVQDDSDVQDLRRIRTRLVTEIERVGASFAKAPAPGAARPERVLVATDADHGARLGYAGTIDPGRDVLMPHEAKVVAGDPIAVVTQNGVPRLLTAPRSGFYAASDQILSSNTGRPPAGDEGLLSGPEDAHDVADLTPADLSATAGVPALAEAARFGQARAAGTIQASPWSATVTAGVLAGVSRHGDPDLCAAPDLAREQVSWTGISRPVREAAADMRDQLGFAPSLDPIAPPAPAADAALLALRVYEAPAHGVGLSRDLWQAPGYRVSAAAREHFGAMRRWMVLPALQDVVWYLEGCIARERARAAHAERLAVYRQKLAQGPNAYLLPGWRAALERALKTMSGLAGDDAGSIKRLRRAFGQDIAAIAEPWAEPPRGYDGEVLSRDFDEFQLVFMGCYAPLEEPLGARDGELRHQILPAGAHVHAGDAVAILVVEGAPRVIEAPRSGFLRLDDVDERGSSFASDLKKSDLGEEDWGDSLDDVELDPLEGDDSGDDPEVDATLRSIRARLNEDKAGTPESRGRKASGGSVDLENAEPVAPKVDLAEIRRTLAGMAGRLHASPWLADTWLIGIEGIDGRQADERVNPDLRHRRIVWLDREDNLKVYDAPDDPMFPPAAAGDPILIGHRFVDPPPYSVELSRALWESVGFDGVQTVLARLDDLPDRALPTLAQELLLFLDGCAARADALPEQARALVQAEQDYATYLAEHEARRAKARKQRERREEKNRRAREARAARRQEAQDEADRRARFIAGWPRFLRWVARWVWDRRA